MCFYKISKMKQLYKTIFHLGNREKKPTLEEIAIETCKWVEKKHRLQLNPDLVNQETSSPVNSAQTIVVEQSEEIEKPQKKYYGLIYNQQDSRQKERSWKVTLAARDDGISDPLVEVVLSTEILDGSTRPEELRLAGPNLVPLLIEKFGAHLNGPLTVQPMRANSGNIRGVVDLINDNKRMLPVIFISAKNDTDKPVIDVESVAKSISGLAHVFSAEQREYYLKTRDLLGERSAYNGAVRLYWPVKSGSYAPIWIPRDFNQKRIELFDKELLNLLARLSVSRNSPVSIDTIERIILDQRFKKMAEGNDWKELAEQYDLENEKLRKEKSEIELLNSTYSEKIISQTHEIQALREAMVELQKLKVNPTLEISGIEEKVNIDSMQTAMREFKKGELSGMVLFAPRAERMIEKSSYQDPEQFLRALQWLGKDYLQAKIGQVRRTNLDDSCKEFCGMRYCAGQSEITMGEHPEEYTLNIDGKIVELKEHLKKGTGRNPSENLRIAFYFDKDSQPPRILIGYVGVHQTNRQT